jgi:3-hydroxyacyl-CoA dehydrogenase
MTAINDVADLSLDGEIAVLTLNSPPVNALSAAVRDGIDGGLDEAIGNPAVKAIVLICAGRTFIAGADISEFGKPPRGAGLHEVLAKIEGSSKPVIAAIHGTALGGGLETALACHYRVGAAGAKFGLPEVKLGLLPGAGGTQRLPRLVGVEKALEMVTSGSMIGAKEAAAKGLIDETAADDGLLAAAVAFAKRVVTEGGPLRKVRDLQVEAAPGVFDAFRKANARKFRGYEAPEANIKCIEAATGDFEAGMRVERELFMGLMNGTQSKAQRYLFFAEREAAKIPGLPSNVSLRPVTKIGIIGAGTMGGGISMNFLSAGYAVVIVETSEKALQRGVGVMRGNYENTAKKGRLTMEAVERNMALLTPSLSLDDLADCDLVIEAVFENMDVKREIFGKLDRIVKQGAILASNTSYLNIDEIAGQCDAAAGSGARREDRAGCAGDGDGGGEEDRQGGGGGRRVPRLYRQPHAGVAPARSEQADPGRGNAVGRGSGDLRFRLSDGAVPDGRSGGAGYRLVGRDVERRHDPRQALRDGPARAEDISRVL